MATTKVNRKAQNSTHRHPKPLTDLHQNWHAWLCHGHLPACKNLSLCLQGFLLPIYVILP